MTNTLPTQKMNAVLGTIIENLRRVRIVEEPTVEIFKTDKAQTGNTREYTVGSFIKTYFPKNFFIRKGPIYSMKDVSKSIDSVLLFPTHPRLTTPERNVIIAEGVFAAIEVKPDISSLGFKSKFHIGLEQIQSVKKLNRRVDLNIGLRNSLPYEHEQHAFHSKIPCVIYSFKSRPAEQTIKYMSECVANVIFQYGDLPDAIVTSDNGIIFFTTSFSSSSLAWLKREYMKTNPDPGEKVFVHLKFSKQENMLAFFIFLMYKFIPPHVPSHDFILTPYLLNNINGTTFTVHPQP